MKQKLLTLYKQVRYKLVLLWNIDKIVIQVEKAFQTLSGDLKTLKDSSATKATELQTALQSLVNIVTTMQTEIDQLIKRK